MSYNDKVVELKELEIELISKIDDIQKAIIQHEQNGITNYGEYNALKNDLAAYQAKITDVQQQIDQLELASIEVQISIENSLEAFEVDGVEFTLRGLCAGEDEYRLLFGYLKDHIGDMAEKHQALKQSLESEITQLQERVFASEKLAAECEELQLEILELNDKLMDAESKRDAAAKELEEVKAENIRLTADNKQLREKLSGENKTGPKSTDEYKELAHKLHMQKPAIYDLRWENEIKRTHYLANLAETDEVIKISYLEKGKYRILEGEELARFREEKANRELEKLAQETISHTPPVSIEKPTLPLSNASVQADSLHREMAAENDTPVTRAEFEALKKDVESIKYELGHMNIAI